MALSREELEREYRAALRREVQLRRQLQEREDLVLHMKAKLLMSIQEIDFELQRLARESDRDTTANDIHRMAPPL